MDKNDGREDYDSDEESTNYNNKNSDKEPNNNMYMEQNIEDVDNLDYISTSSYDPAI